MKSLLFFLLLPAMLLAGCATNHPSVSAWHDAQFSLTRTNRIALTLRPNPTAEDARLGRLLTAELEREGFQLVPLTEADYALTYMVENNPVEGQVPIGLPIMPTPPQSTGQILKPEMFSTSYGGQPGYGVYQAPVPTKTVEFDYKSIRLYLYTNPKKGGSRLQLAWTGSITGGESISARREPLLIQALLGYFGQDYSGPVLLPE